MHQISFTRNLIPMIGGTALSYFIYKSLKIYMMRRQYDHIPGPPTKGILGFYFGNLEKLVNVMNNGQILSDVMIEWTEIYGRIFKFQVLDQVIVFSISTEGVKEVLINKNFPKPFGIYGNVAYPYNERFMGNGILSDSNQTRWRLKRTKLNPGFHRQVLKSFVDELNLKSDILLERFKTIADGKTCVKMFDEMNHIALDIIASIAFGMNVNSINDPSNELNICVYESVKGFYRIQFEPFLSYNPLEWGYIYRYKQNLNKLREIGRNEILKRLKLLENNDYVIDDILTYLLKSHSEEKFDIEDMVDEFTTFFVAGQETTANTLAFCFLEIARHPEVMKKLRIEIDEVLGSRNEITYEDLNKLTYLLSVYKETLRLWPPIPEIARGVDKKCQIEGYNIPVNTWVQVSTYVSARQEDYFSNPREFIPERFNSDQSQNIKNYTYFPFSLGPRNCIGQNLAQMVGKIIIAKIVKNFDITLDMSQNLGVRQVATLRPADNARCFLTPRVY